MKRFGLVLVVACLMALVVSGTAAATGGGGHHSRDFVIGSIKRLGVNDSLERHFTVAAFETRWGAEGIYHATYGKGADRTSYSGRVTCVNVVGQNAMVGIQVTRSNGVADAVVGTGELIRISNYGGPNVPGQRDSISPGAFSPTAPTVCPAPIQVATPTFAGNIIIHDGD